MTTSSATSRAQARRPGRGTTGRRISVPGLSCEFLQLLRMRMLLPSLAAIARLDEHVGLPPVRIGGPLILFAGRSVNFMAVGTLAMKNRSSFAAAQQLFADTASTLVANIQHKQRSFANDFARSVE